MPGGGESPSIFEVIYLFADAVMSTRSPLAFSRISLKNMVAPPTLLFRNGCDIIEKTERRLSALNHNLKGG